MFLHQRQEGIGWLFFLRFQSRLYISKNLFLFDFFRKDEEDEINNNLVLYLRFIKIQFNLLSKRKATFIVLLKQIKHVKGKKIIFNKPLNGQRTHTNAQTVKKLFIKNKI